MFKNQDIINKIGISDLSIDLKDENLYKKIYTSSCMFIIHISKNVSFSYHIDIVNPGIYSLYYKIHTKGLFPKIPFKFDIMYIRSDTLSIMFNIRNNSLINHSLPNRILKKFNKLYYHYVKSPKMYDITPNATYDVRFSFGD